MNIKFMLVAAAICTTTASLSATPIEGWYGQAFGGYAYLPNTLHNFNNGFLRSNVHYQTGFDAGGSLGFKSNPMRYEGEVTYLQANVNRFKINAIPQVGVNGYNNAVLGLANIYYDAPSISPILQPFLGAGIGYAWVQATLNSTGPFGSTRFTGNNSVFAYQATGGITYHFAENYALSFGYRYIGTSNAPDYGSTFQAHLANLGAIYRFDGDSYK